MNYNSGAIVRRLNEGSTLTKVMLQPSPVTDKRIAAQAQIAQMAKDAGISLDAALTRMFKDPDTQARLIHYVRGSKETAFREPLKLAMQAALLRFQDIATVAKALNISDEQALIQIEASEYEALQYNNPDAGILPIDIAAMLADVVEEFLNAASRHGLPEDAIGLYNYITNILGDNYDASAAQMLSGISAVLANHADGDTPNPGYTGYEDYENPNGGGTEQDNATHSSTGDGSATNTGGMQAGQSNGSTDSGFDWSSIFSGINSAIGVVKNAGGALTSLTGAAKTSSSTVNDILNKLGGGVGGAAINNSSLPWLIGGGFLLLILIIVAFHYAGKNK